MEVIIFCGIQATGKTSFYTQNFVQTHVRISLDLLNTRNKERVFIKTCLDFQQRFVVDNTNPTRKDRSKYIKAAQAKKFKIVGYFIQSEVEDAIARNQQRKGKEKIPVVGIRAAYKRLEEPQYDEGFDKLYRVGISDGEFVVTNREDNS